VRPGFHFVVKRKDRVPGSFVAADEPVREIIESGFSSDQPVENN
jgi:hypothetical protein